MKHEFEIHVSPQYVHAHPWVVQGITGFLSAYFMAKPDFRVQRHRDDVATGRHIWSCEAPPDMKVLSLLRRLQHDIPPCHVIEVPAKPDQPRQYVIDCPEPDASSL